MQDSEANKPIDKINPREYICPIGLLNDDNDLIRFRGTGFGIERLGLVLTAAHVIGSAKPDRIFLELQPGQFVKPLSVTRHPTVDVAGLVFEENQSPRAFKLGKPTTGEDFYLGEDVITFGYPSASEGPGKVKLKPRLMCGHIQRHFKHAFHEYRFAAYELSFPVIDGQSGSPVLLEHGIDYAIAILTGNFDSSTVVDSHEEHEADGTKEVHKVKKVITYGVGAALLPLSGWVRSETKRILKETSY